MRKDIMWVVVSFCLVACGSSDPTSSATVTNKRLFVTSTAYSGYSIISVSNADATCNTCATAAGLEGTWKAWISGPTVNAIDRIVDVGPWYKIDGSKAFNNKVNLMTTPIVNINVDENGNTVAGGVFTWTGTKTGGTTGRVCWDGAFGAATYGIANGTTNWTENGVYDCGNANGHLYCIEQ